MSKRQQKRKWKSSFTLNRIQRDADDLRLRMATLPRCLSARRLARFLGVSKTPVLQWIRRGNLSALKRGKRLVVEKGQIEVLIAAACSVTPYSPPIRPRYLKLWRQQRRLRTLSQSKYSVKQFADHFHCSPATIRRAIHDGQLRAYRKESGRWWLKAEKVPWSRVFLRRWKDQAKFLSFDEKIC
jgi:hypothetical protein